MFRKFLRHKNHQTEMAIYKPFGFWFAIGALLIFADQASKRWASIYAETLFLNDKFAFSLPLPVIVMYAIYAAALFTAGYYIRINWHALDSASRVGWLLILSGGISNVGERIYFGYVRDFIPVANGIVNLADIYILAGIVLILSTPAFRKS